MIIRRSWDSERRKKKKRSGPYEIGELRRMLELPEEQNTAPRAAQSYQEIVNYGYLGVLSHEHGH